MTTDHLTAMSLNDAHVEAPPPPRGAGLPRRPRRPLGHRGRHRLVEDAGDDVLLGELAAGHAAGERAGGRRLHLVLGGARAAGERPAEDAGGAATVVRLVRVIRAP